MSFNIYTTSFFDKQLKTLSKKYPSLKNDYKSLIYSLKEEPQQGQALGKDCYKIRMAIHLREKVKAAAVVLYLVLKLLPNRFSFYQSMIKAKRKAFPTKNLTTC